MYHTAGLGIILDPLTNHQTFMTEHREDILALDINPSGTLVVTGEIGPDPRLCLWSADSGECYHTQRKPLTKGIRHVCFSKDGMLVGASDLT